MKEKEQLENYNKNLKNVTKKTFKDVPDEVKKIRVVAATCSSITLEWKAPKENNSKISSYSVYLSDSKQIQSSSFKKVSAVSET